MSTTTTNDNIRLSQIIDKGLNIYGSREKIRNNLVELAKTYLNISKDSDISKASYLAYLIDMLSILSSNQIYYQSKIYNEFFLVTASLNESVQNLAKWIGYKIPKATCSTANIMFMLPLKFTIDINFNIGKYFQTRAGDIPFTIKSNNTLFDTNNSSAATFNLNREKIKYATQGQIVDNSAITIRDYNGNYRPVFIGQNKDYCAFTLEFEQCKYEIQTFTIPEDLQLNQFYNKQLFYKGQVADIQVYICSPTNGQTLNLNSIQTENVQNIETFDPTEPIIDSSGQICKFTQWTECVNGIYTISSTSKQFDWIGYYDKGILSFGNGILGKQPTPGSFVVCVMKITEGANGNVINNTIISGDPLTIQISNGNSITTSSISYTCTNNNASFGGKDILSTSEIKNNAIINLKARKRLVTDDDYDNITDVVEGTTLSDCIPILKRSDIRVNDITLYFIMNYMLNKSNEIVPTRNCQLDLVDPFGNLTELSIPKNTIIPVGPEQLQFTTIFNMKLDKPTRIASYDYTATNVQGVISEIYTQSVYDELNQSVYFNCNTADFSIDFDKLKSINNQYPVNIKLNVTNISNKVLCEDKSTGIPFKNRGDLNYVWTVDDLVPTFKADGTTQTVNNFEILHFKGIMTTKWGNYEEYTELSPGYKEDADPPQLMEGDDGNIYAVKTYRSLNWVIPSYTTIPQGKQRYEFQILCYAPKTDEMGRVYAKMASKDCEEYIAIDENGKWTEVEGSHTTDEIVMQWKPIKKYFSDVIITQDLSDCMQSSIGIDNKLKGIGQYKFSDTGKVITDSDESPSQIKKWLDDGTIVPIDVYHVYEIPCIYKNYYEQAMNKENSDFELSVIQKLLENINFSDKRMMTDFTNIKFADTYGSLKNLIYNKHSYMVESRYNHTPFWKEQQGDSGFPAEEIVNTRENPSYVEPHPLETPIYYIANGPVPGYEELPVSEYFGYIVLRIPTTNNSSEITYSYTLVTPSIGDCIKIKDELDYDGNIQTCYWGGHEWIPVEQYSIPLKLSLKVHVDEDKVATSDDALKTQIIDTLSQYYNDTQKMGLQREIDRSEIIKVCRSVEGVQYVEVLNPQFDIKFDYNVNELKQEQLLTFTPQYIGFRTLTDTVTEYKDTSISIEIVRR